MRLCITLDDVIRAKTQQFGTIYKKGVDPNVDLDALDMTNNDLKEVFGLTKEKYIEFLYKDYPFEIFAEAPVVEKMLDKKLNLWHLSLEDSEIPVELVLSNPNEFNASIGFTYFFLSNIATRVREVFFPKAALDIWNKCDVLVTADPRLLNNKPEGKVAVKIEMPYNKDCNADFAFETLSKFIDTENIIEKINERLG